MFDIQRVAERMRSASDLDEFWNISLEELAAFGVSGVFYGQLASSSEKTEHSKGSHDLPLPRGLLSKTSYPQDFLHAFENQSLLENDPTVTHCLLNDSVLFWEYDEQWAEQNPWYRKRYEIERDFGFHKGCSIPSRFFSDRWIGGVGVVMSEVPDDEYHDFWKQNQKHIVSLCGLMEIGMRNVHAKEFVGLTPREQECLTWLAAGFTPQEIAPRMRIEPKRVAKLVAQSKIKLKARTRDHAVVRALLLGVIEP